jgi:hypothetical protein
MSMTLLVIALVTMGALIAQYRLTHSQETIVVSKAEVGLLLASMPQQQRELYSDDEKLRQLVNTLQESIYLGQEARRLGLASRPETAYQMDLQRDLLLSSAFRDRHPETQVPAEEVDKYFREHPDAESDFLRYNPRFRSGQTLDERIRQQLAEIRLLGAKARQAGVDKDAGVALQLKYFPDSILREAMIRELQTTTQVSQEEISRFYQEHQSQFQQVRARHILFSLQPAADKAPSPDKPLDKEAVRRRALHVLDRVKAGEDFAALAQEFSEDPGSRDTGGDLGFFGRRQMTPAFEKAAFALAPGQISDLVETPFGFHIIKAEERRIAPFDDSVKPQIENALRRRKFRDRRCQIWKRYPVIVDGATRPCEEGDEADAG